MTYADIYLAYLNTNVTKNEITVASSGSPTKMMIKTKRSNLSFEQQMEARKASCEVISSPSRDSVSSNNRFTQKLSFEQQGEAQKLKSEVISSPLRALVSSNNQPSSSINIQGSPSSVKPQADRKHAWNHNIEKPSYSKPNRSGGHLLGISRRDDVYATIDDQNYAEDDDGDTNVMGNHDGISINMSYAHSVTTCSIPPSDASKHDEESEHDLSQENVNVQKFIGSRSFVDTDETRSSDEDERDKNDDNDVLSDAPSSISGITNPTYVESLQHKHISKAKDEVSKSKTEAMAPLVANIKSNLVLQREEALPDQMIFSNSNISNTTSTAFEPFSIEDDNHSGISPEWDVQSPPAFAFTMGSSTASAPKAKTSEWETDFNNIESPNYFREHSNLDVNDFFASDFMTNQGSSSTTTPTKSTSIINQLFGDMDENVEMNSVDIPSRTRSPGVSLKVRDSSHQLKTAHRTSPDTRKVSNRSPQTQTTRSTHTEFDDLFDNYNFIPKQRSQQHAIFKEQANNDNSVEQKHQSNSSKAKPSANTTMDPSLRRKMLERARKLKESRRREILLKNSSDYTAQENDHQQQTPPILPSISSSTSAFTPPRQSISQSNSTISAEKALQLRLKEKIATYKKEYQQQTRATVIDLKDSLSSEDGFDTSYASNQNNAFHVQQLIPYQPKENFETDDDVGCEDNSDTYNDEEPIIQASKSHEEIDGRSRYNYSSNNHTRISVHLPKKPRSKSDIGVGTKSSNESLLNFRRRMAQNIPKLHNKARDSKRGGGRKESGGYTSESSMRLSFGTDAYNDCLEVD